jgi:hypothetical protein
LPLRTEIAPAFARIPDARFNMHLGSIKPVSNKLQGTVVDFPYRAEVTFPNGGGVAWVIQNATINPPVSDEDFILTPPAFSEFDEIPRKKSSAPVKETMLDAGPSGQGDGAGVTDASPPGRWRHLVLPIAISGLAALGLLALSAGSRLIRRRNV